MDTQERETLGEYVRRVRNEKDYSLSRVERNSNGEIDGSYVNRVENGLIKNVSPEKLKALAKGLNVSEEEMFAVARGKSLEKSAAFDSEIYRILEGFEELSDADKAELLVSAKMLGAEVQRRRQMNSVKKDEPAPEQLKRVWVPVVKGTSIDPKWAAAQEAKAAAEKADSTKRKAK